MHNLLQLGGWLSLFVLVTLPVSAANDSSRWGTGDWGGTRSELLEKGVDFTLGYVGEAAANLHGGYNDDRTARYTSQWALGTHLDLQNLFGWNAAEFQLLVTERWQEPVKRSHR